MPALHFRARHRLSRDRDYRAVFDAKVRKHAGPLTVWSKPSGLPHARLGLSIGRRFGNAVARNALKRRLREAFRHIRHDHETIPLDLVLTIRPHERLTTAEYTQLLDRAWAASENEWRKRTGRADPNQPC